MILELQGFDPRSSRKFVSCRVRFCWFSQGDKRQIALAFSRCDQIVLFDNALILSINAKRALYQLSYNPRGKDKGPTRSCWGSFCIGLVLLTDRM